MIPVLCPRYRKRLNFNDSAAGKTIPCKFCGKKVIVPTADNEAEEGIPLNVPLPLRVSFGAESGPFDRWMDKWVPVAMAGGVAAVGLIGVAWFVVSWLRFQFGY